MTYSTKSKPSKTLACSAMKVVLSLPIPDHPTTETKEKLKPGLNQPVVKPPIASLFVPEHHVPLHPWWSSMAHLAPCALPLAAEAFTNAAFARVLASPRTPFKNSCRLNTGTLSSFVAILGNILLYSPTIIASN